VWIQATGGKKILGKTGQCRVSRIIAFTIYYCDDKIMEDEICGTCDMHGGRREMYTYVYINMFYYICVLTKFLLIMKTRSRLLRHCNTYTVCSERMALKKAKHVA